MEPLFKKNHVFGNEDFGLKLLKDVYHGDVVKTDDFIPLGNCPRPVPFEEIPYELAKEMLLYD